MTTRTEATFFPPIPEAQRWLQGVEFPADRPLLNLAQAAPADPPPPAMRRAMAELIEVPSSHLYGPVLGHGEPTDEGVEGLELSGTLPLDDDFDLATAG